MRKLLYLLVAAALAACTGTSTTATNGNTTTSGGTTTTSGTGDGTATGTPANIPAPEKIRTIEGITEYQLHNGLQVLLFPDDSQEKVTVNVTYFVGSRHEGYGEAGMAHLLEHMVFKGTPTHPDIWNLLKKHGASFNGTTWVDRTNYFETLAATDENLAFAIAMEADRMVNSTIAAEELAKEFSVVRNEFESGENNPTRVLMQRMQSAAYLWHNYGKSTIGNRSDIERVPVDNLRAFYEKYYQPDNAMVVVAGKFDEAKALDLVQQHFGAIPRPDRELAKTHTVEPIQDGERQVTLRRVGDTQVVGLVYHGVPGPHEDSLPIQAAAHILTDEPSGRLYKALVESGMASSVSGFAWPTKEPGTIMFLAEVPVDKPLEPVKDKMISVVEGLGDTDITKEEVTRFINRSKKQTELFFADSQSIAIALTEFAAQGDWRLLFIERDRLDTVTQQQVQGVAQKYLRRSNRTLGLFIPTKKPKRAPQPEQPDVLALVDGYKGTQTISEGEAFEASIANVEARTERTTLDSGMKVAMLAKETRGDKVRASLTLRFGNERLLRGKLAAADMVPEMLMRGTKNRSYQEIRDELDRLKASVSFGAGGGPFAALSGSPGTVTVRIETIRDSLPEVLALVAEILKEPAFPADQFKILKQERITGLEGQLSDPMAQGFLELFRTLYAYPKNNVRYIPTTKEQIARTERVKLPELRRFHKQFFGASHGEMAIVGDFDAAATEKLLAEHFGSWKSPRKYARIDSKYKKTKSSSRDLDFPDKAMALIAAGHQIEIRDDHPDYPALVMLGYVMGGNPNSRMMARLRHKEGLSYGAFGFAAADSKDEVGILGAGAIVAPQNADKAMKIMIEELEKLVAKGIPKDELDEAKASYAKQFEQQLANDQMILGKLGSYLYLGRTLEWDEELNAKIQALTSEDMARVIPKYIRTDELATLISGDLSKRNDGDENNGGDEKKSE